MSTTARDEQMSAGRTLDLAAPRTAERRREAAPLARPTAIVLLVAALSTPLLLQPWIASDGIGYYAYFRSLLFDGDLDFGNEFAHYTNVFERHGAPTLEGIQKAPRHPVTLNPVISEPERTATGLVWNPWPVGSAMLWAPFGLATWGAIEGARAVGFDVPNDGYSAPYELAVGLGTVVYGVIGLLLCVQLCALYFSERATLIAILATWFGTTFVFYLFVMPSYAHVNSMFTVTLLVWYWHRRFFAAETAPDGRAAFVLGAIAGLMSAVQWTNVTYLVTFGALAAWTAWEMDDGSQPFVRLLRYGVCVTAGWLLTFAPQLVVNEILYGGIVANPQPTGFFDALTNPYLFGVLFSTDRGLFVWTPLAFVGLVGVVLCPKHLRVLAAVLGLNFLLHLYVNSSAESWQGGGFGQRRFTNQALLFALGIAVLVERMQGGGTATSRSGRIWSLVVPGVLVAWNLLLILQYVLWIAPHWGTYPLGELVRGQFRALGQLGHVLRFLL